MRSDTKTLERGGESWSLGETRREVIPVSIAFICLVLWQTWRSVARLPWSSSAMRMRRWWPCLRAKMPSASVAKTTCRLRSWFNPSADWHRKVGGGRGMCFRGGYDGDDYWPVKSGTPYPSVENSSRPDNLFSFTLAVQLHKFVWWTRWTPGVTNRIPDLRPKTG